MDLKAVRIAIYISCTINDTISFHSVPFHGHSLLAAKLFSRL